MTAKTLLTLALFATVFTNESRAAVMSRDWKTPGDGLLTYDDVNQREWLDVPETLLFNFGSFENVIAQTGPGGVFAGFGPATLDQFIGLAESAGIDIGTRDFGANHINTRRLVELLGPTHQFPPGGVSLTIGVLDELEEDCDCRLFVNLSVGPSGAGVSPFTDTTGFDAPGVVKFAGVFLVRPVPEPATSLMTFIGAGCLLLASKRRSRKSPSLSLL